MLFLTLLALEGMAHIAYYAAYGAGYGGGSTASLHITPPPPIEPEDWTAYSLRILHPFYGFTRDLPNHALNEMPLPLRREDTIVVALLGGSVARDVHPFLERALQRWFAANGRPQYPLVREFAVQGIKQPQQAAIVANALLLGGEFDLIVNLDGLNEVAESARQGFDYGVFPPYPPSWHKRVGLTTEGVLRAGRLRILRQEQARRTAAGETSPLRRSALFGLANRWRRESAARQIIQLNHELAEGEAAYSLEKHGPRSGWEGEDELLPAAARIWYRGSVALARLAELAAADYYHFLQPNQYAPDSKPLSPEELALAYNPQGVYGYFAAKGYPLLQQFNPDLQRQGINYFDLTGIFVDHPETLYRDPCCHLNARGNELLAAAMVRRLEPALRRLSRESPAAPVSALAAARRPTEPDLLLVAADFQVYISGNGKRLRYVRAGCTTADVESRFFLHLTPQDPAALPPHRRDHGYDNRDFSFAEVDGRFWQGQCLAYIPLPDYPIAYLRTGQYVPGAGELWAGEFYFPE